MGNAIACGFWVHGLVGAQKGTRGGLVLESLPRMFVAILGGAVGGAITGLIGFTGAELFK